MNPITLNIIAVSVFVVTLLSLLGPLIHVTPDVVAIATTACFGLVAVDRIGWQGLGGTLIIDWLSQRSPDYRQRIVHHEAGHFLVAHLLEIPITGYTLNAWDAWRAGIPGNGGVVFEATEIEAEMAQGTLSAQQLNRYSTVWMAGIAAEQLVYGNSQGGQDDWLKLQQLWQQLNRPLAEATLKRRWSVLQAKTLLEREATAYQALVTAMAEGASVESCQAVIEQNRGLNPQGSA
jgi:hypothetical protein